jgi:SAM-dependent methyltransferase
MPAHNNMAHLLSADDVYNISLHKEAICMGATPSLNLPPPPGADSQPIWTGRGFRVGDSIQTVLKYRVADSGWTDELTSFHEATAGENHYIDIASREHAVTRLERWVPAPHPTIIEIGCSSGFLLKSIRDRLPGAILVGSDFVLDPLERLAANLPEVPLIQFDLLECPLPDNSFDAAVLLNVLEHIERDDLALAQTFRIMKPGGIAVLEVPAGPGLYDVYDKQLLHWRRYQMTSFAALVQGAGFEIVERSHLGCFLYPAFWGVKKWNRRRLSASDETQRAIVAKSIRRSAGSPLMNRVMRLEARLRSVVYYPFGIRCLIVARKPARPAGVA